MNVPDLSQAADAGVHDWSGAPDALKSAAGAAKLRFRSIDLHGVVSKTELDGRAGARDSSCPSISAATGTRWPIPSRTATGSARTASSLVLRHTAPYRKAHAADWETLTDIFGEAAEYWHDVHKPFWVFVA